MNLLAQLRAHRTAALAGAGGLVALLALAHRKAAGASAAADSATSGYGSSGGPAYDSTATDIYNSLEPMIEQLYQQVDKLSQVGTLPVTTPVAPKPKPTPGPPIHHPPPKKKPPVKKPVRGKKPPAPKPPVKARRPRPRLPIRKAAKPPKMPVKPIPVRRRGGHPIPGPGKPVHQL